MPKNFLVSDIKPKNRFVSDTKSQNSLVLDSKPKMNTFGPEITRSYSVVLGAGQSMGLLLALTYPTAGTVTQWSEIG